MPSMKSRAWSGLIWNFMPLRAWYTRSNAVEPSAAGAGVVEAVADDAFSSGAVFAERDAAGDFNAVGFALGRGSPIADGAGEADTVVEGDGLAGELVSETVTEVGGGGVGIAGAGFAAARAGGFGRAGKMSRAMFRDPPG